MKNYLCIRCHESPVVSNELCTACVIVEAENRARIRSIMNESQLVGGQIPGTGYNKPVRKG